MTDEDDWSEHLTANDLQAYLIAVNEVVAGKLARIRLGVYSEEQDGTLQEVLEEIERILR